MKKYTAICLTLALISSTALSACAQTTASVNTSSPSQLQASQTIKSTNSIATPLSTTSTYSSINSKHLKFDAGVKQFFGTDVDSTLSKIEPLLISAGRAEKAYKTQFISYGEPLEPNVAWSIVHTLLNTYEYKNSEVSQKSDGTLVVTAKGMKEIFSTAFIDFSGEIPKIPSDYDDMITLDKNGNYNISRSDGDELDFQLKNITISKANSATDPTQSATIIMDVLSSEGDKLTTVAVEVRHNINSTFLYSIQSVEIINDEE